MPVSPEPWLLIVETSGRTGFVALARGGGLRGFRTLAESRRHCRDLAPAIGDLLSGEGLKPAGVDAIVVSKGPGSYTGLRVGIMSAKTLAYASGCRLLAIETFHALACQVPAEAARVEVLADAQQEKVYVQRFKRSGSRWEAEAPLAIEPFGAWLAGRGDGSWVTGPALQLFAARLPAGAKVVSAADWDPRPQSLLDLGLARYLAGEQDDFWSLEPLYLRASAAEEKWQQRLGAPAM